MSELRWPQASGVEIRIGRTPPIHRLALGHSRRSGDGPLFTGSATAPSLPGLLVPLLDRDGLIVPRDRVHALVPAHALHDAELVFGEDHPLIAIGGFAARVVPAVWIDGAGELDHERITAELGTLPGLVLRQDETVVGAQGDLASPAVAYLQRLPRIVMAGHDLIADNTDGALSMGYLLEDFVRRFTDAGRVLPNVRVATGYLYNQGLRRVLRLLEHEGVHSLQVLFSGKTDARTARAITSQLASEIVADVEEDETSRAFELYRAALASGRLRFRVYTDAFLHAKLFLGWEGVDRHGKLIAPYAVVGSSNLSAGGLQHGGNLELDVTVEERDTCTRLGEWFEARWDEASEPEPALLEVLETHRPLPPPTFLVPGVAEVWEAGRSGRLVSPERHLALLAGLYADRIKRVILLDETAFPRDDRRQLVPTREQEEGVLALAERLLSSRVAFLADSVGLGKTATALGTIWYLRRHGRVRKALLISPRKLLSQWEDDAASLRAPRELFEFVNRHLLERMAPERAKARLGDADLIVVEEAHEALRTRTNKLWVHLREHLRRHPECRVLFVSATPWNNRREDIFNYLLLGWNDWPALTDTYPALQEAPLSNHASTFRAGLGGSLTVTQAVRQFESLPVAAWRRVFDEAFVQRTRSSLVRRYGTAPDFPERRVKAHSTPASPDHDALFASLEAALQDLAVPYQEPLRAVLRAADAIDPAGDDSEGFSNLRRSFVIQLFKRAESSEFALAVSLAGIERRLRAMQADLEGIEKSKKPLERLREWLEGRIEGGEPAMGDLFEPEDEGAEGAGRPELRAAEQARVDAVRELCGRLDNRRAKAVARRVLDDQVTPDLAKIQALRAQVTLDFDERSPKGLLLAGLVRDALPYKPILVAGYADTAIRAFVRLVTLFPDKRIGLALGGNEAWLYRPGVGSSAPLNAGEWNDAIASSPADRRQRLLNNGRAQEVRREELLAAFAPKARHAKPELIVRMQGVVDILVGSEAISVGHNLQDSTCLVQLDLPWNPMVIEQRIGRIDRRGGGRPDGAAGRRIVDVHYCWSHAAIEREVALRQRLREKAGGAIADTNFDELLLFELADVIENVRRERGAAPAQDATGAWLGRRQQELAEARANVKGIRLGAGSNVDAIRHLARWAQDRPDLDGVEPVVAASAREVGTDGLRWLVTVELTPRREGGAVVEGPPIRVQLVLGGLPKTTADDLTPELEALVAGLMGAVPGPGRPGGTRAGWTSELVALDRLLAAFRELFLKTHNDEINERIREALRPAAAREPTARLRQALVEAKRALEAEMKRLIDGGQAWIVTARKERLAFLMTQVFDTARVVDLLAHESEDELLPQLADVRALVHDFVTNDFEAKFDRLVGRYWRAVKEPPAQAPKAELPGVQAQERLWASLDARVLGATVIGA